MEDKGENPHDRFIRDLFSNLPLVRELFRISLPDEILQNLYLEDLTQRPGNFFDDELAESKTDLLFQVPCRRPEGSESYILIEHKSTADYKTPGQIHGYLILIYEKTEYKSPVICYVLYNGKRPWTFLSRLNDRFKKYEDGLKQYLPFGNIVPFDLADTDLDTLEISLTLRACLFTLKYIRTPDFRKWLPGLFDILKGLTVDERNIKILERLVVYIYQCSDINLKVYEEYIKATQKEEMEKIMVTTYEQILREGELKGEQRGKLEVARNALENGFTLEDVEKITGLSGEELIREGVIDNRVVDS